MHNMNNVTSNLDARSKKGKKSKRKYLSNESHEDTIENSKKFSVTLNADKKQKSKKLKLMVDGVSESVDSEFISNKNEIFSYRLSENVGKNSLVNDEKVQTDTQLMEVITSGTVDSKLTVQVKNGTSANPKNGKKKKKTVKFCLPESSAFESVNNQLNSSSNLINSEKLEKKKFKKKKSKRKNEPKSLPSTEESFNNSNTTSRREKAILYLETWKNDRNNWKFEKLNQFWLLKNMFNETQLSKETFEILLEYFVNLKGNSKNFVIKSCESIIKKKEEIPASEEEDEVLECAYERARSILQCL